MLKTYLNTITNIASYADAREESYYPALKDLLENYSQTHGNRDVYITTLPKKTEAGNPDFRI
ncbi:MAG: adenine methyltransferase, partial [Thermodesulfovibrionales bacterium]